MPNKTIICSACSDTGFARKGKLWEKCTACEDAKRAVEQAAQAAADAKVIAEAEAEMNRQLAATAAALKAQAAAQLRVIQLKNTGLSDADLDTFAECGSWSEFARSMMTQAGVKKWSDNQKASAASMIAKVRAKQAAKASGAPVAPKAVIDLSPIRAMFDAATASGYKKPSYRAEGLVLSLAASWSKNPGAIYVKSTGGAYYGKVVGKTFSATQEGRRDGVEALLLEIAKDPLAAAIKYGQRTGNCACCGRLLTNHNSINLGIGPICAQKWGWALPATSAAALAAA